jgi:murein DD-endopeptidase MepM/ murein hydrolase activator NlpD
MENILVKLIVIAAAAVAFNFSDISFFANPKPDSQIKTEQESKTRIIADIVKSSDTLESIFNRYGLSRAELADIYGSSKREYNLSKLMIGNIYKFELDSEENTVLSMKYGIDDTTYLNIMKQQDGFMAEKVTLNYERHAGSFFINIKNNLISSMPGTHSEYHRLATELSDIYAWDIDFSHDIRNGDYVKVIVEELWLGDVFKGYGQILAAEFLNNGKIHKSYLFDNNGNPGYYDENGKSLTKTLLKSPLKFSISSRFSKRRLHPILRVYRPHLGVDYAAPVGTPVSASGSGKIQFSGYKGQMGKMVKIKHPGGYMTYYGHLSRIPKTVRKGAKVAQGDIIGYVGTTGLTTGPHLDYRIKFNGRFVNPLKVNLPRGTSVPAELIADFRQAVDKYNIGLSSMSRPVIAFKSSRNKAG